MYPQPQLLSAGMLPRQLVSRLGVPTAVRAIMQPRLRMQPRLHAWGAYGNPNSLQRPSAALAAASPLRLSSPTSGGSTQRAA